MSPTGRGVFQAPRILSLCCHSGDRRPEGRRSQSAPGRTPLRRPSRSVPVKHAGARLEGRHSWRQSATVRVLEARLEGRHSWRPLSSVGCSRSSAAGRLGAFLRSSPTGPGPAKSCVKRSGGFPTPTPSGGLKVPPPIRPTPAPPEPSEGNRGEEGDKNVPPPRVPHVFEGVGVFLPPLPRGD